MVLNLFQNQFLKLQCGRNSFVDSIYAVFCYDLIAMVNVSLRK